MIFYLVLMVADYIETKGNYLNVSYLKNILIKNLVGLFKLYYLILWSLDTTEMPKIFKILDFILATYLLAVFSHNRNKYFVVYISYAQI